MPPYRKSQRGWLTGDTLAPITGRVLFIPGDLAFLMAVNGALTELTMEWNWEQFGTVTPEEAADAMRIMLADYFKSEAPVITGSDNVILFGINAVVKTGNAMAFVVNAGSRFNGYYLQNPGATGDKHAYDRFLDAGDWQYRMTYFRNTNNGIINLRVSDAGGLVENVSLDLYGAALANAYQVGSFTLTKGGDTEISVEVTGKNASSSSFFVPIMSLEMWRQP